MIEEYQKFINKVGENKIIIDEPLFGYTSFKIGGPADLFLKVRTIKELTEAYQTALDLRIPVFILGGGTNILVSDRGFRGLVIKNESSTISLIGIKGNRLSKFNQPNLQMHTVFIRSESGVTMNRLVRYTLDQGLSGLESFLGQPGTVGGSVYINSHNLKTKKFFGDVIIEALILDCNTGIPKTVPVQYFRFNYDDSYLLTTKEIVLSVTLKLQKKDNNIIWKLAQEGLDYRKKTQPYGYFSAGCTFRNINISDAMRSTTPNHTCSAGFLIESVGLKGKTIGGAQFSDKHANFIINMNKAASSDVLQLINLAKSKVKEKYNIDLKEEILLVGDFSYG